ncbi:MAG: DUF423 domain-containing protein [Myxococcota bacterium]
MNVLRDRWLAAGAVLGGFAVALGAFGAHALKSRVSVEDLAIWRTAVEYQMYHALALILAGLWSRSQPSPWLARAGVAFVIGSVVFSGSLYGLVLSGIRGLGAVTPVGGVAFLIGWACLLVAAWREQGSSA